MAEDPAERRVVIGHVVKPHGIRGEVVVEPLTDLPERFEVGAAVSVGATARTVRASRPHQGRLLVAFEDVVDRSTAERLRGLEVEAAPLDVAEHEHYFVHELIDLPVVDEHGSPLGRVVALVELPDAAGYDLLEVARDDGSSWWLPAVDELVVVEPCSTGEAGLQLRVVDPPQGLIDGAADVVPREDTEDGAT